MTALKFRRRKGDIYTRLQAEDVHVWVGVAIHQDARECRMVPAGGLRSDRVHTIVSRCLGEPRESFVTATVSTNFGYLLPGNDYLEFVADNVEEVNGCVDGFVEILTSIVDPYLSQRASISDIETMLQGHGWTYSVWAAYALPVVMYVQGKTDKALVELDRTAAATSASDTQVVGQHFTDFATNLRTLMLSSS